jgi:DNA-binding MarR family transcriptional regulator
MTPMKGHDTHSDTPSDIAYLVGHLERLVRRRLGEAISPLGLTIQQYTALSVLHARGPLSNAQLAERSLVTPQSANEMVKTMEKHGWVERSANPSHGRIIHLHLTPLGGKILQKAHAAAAKFEEGMLQGLTTGDRQRYREYLSASVRALSLTSINLSKP